MSTSKGGLILIVDDDAFTRTLLRDALAEVGHQTLSASTGDDALALLPKHPVDVVLLDLIMPGIHGVELLERVHREHPTVEVIVCTGVSDVDMAVAALRSRAFDYLLKPIVPAVVQAAVARALDTRRLLGENVRLRRALDLVLAGQRVLGSVEFDGICALTLEGLIAMTASDAGALGSTEPAASRDLHGEVARNALAGAREALQGRAGERVVVLATPPAGLGVALGIEIGEGVCALVGRRKADPDYGYGEIEAAQFLSRHAQQALQNHARYAAAEEAARRDSLTGLLNARVLEEVVTQSLGRARVSGGRFSVLFLDLDDFKKVNDVHGHLLGSRLLCEMASVLQRAVREGDLVFRYGGDEFSVVLHDASRDDARRVAERLRHAVEAHPFLVREGVRVAVTASVGSASWPGDADSPADLLARADAAMYDAKHGGKNRVALSGTAS